MKSTALRRAGVAVVLVGSVAGRVTLSALPSYATTTIVPKSESLYSVTCDNSLPNAQVLSINSGTGASTKLGQGNSTFSSCPWNAQWDDGATAVYTYSLLLAPAVAQPVTPPTKSTLATTGINPVPGEITALMFVAVGGILWGASGLHRRRRSRA